MRNTLSTVASAALVLTLLGISTKLGFAQTAGDRSVNLAKPRKAERRQAPERLVITAERLPDAGVPESVWLGRSRALPAVDAYGIRRRQDEPRFVTGSLVKQRFELYGNATNLAVPVFIYTQDDLRKGTAGFLGGPFGRSYSDFVVSNPEPRWLLDLRRVPPEKRLAVVTQLVGPERARQAFDEARAQRATGFDGSRP